MIEKHICPNGLRIVVEKVPTVRSVTIGVWVLTGSRNETKEENGLSHFIEHMLFKGTKTRNAQEIAESFDAIGGHVNAFTSKEYTCYYARVIDSFKEDALEMLADMFFHSVFSEEELEREKKVIIEEIKMYEDSPDDIVFDLLGEATFNGHSLGRPIIGTEQLIQQFSRQDLIRYKETHYSAGNVVISVAGNVDDSFIKNIETKFNQFTNEQADISIEKPTFYFDRLMRKKDTEQAHLCLGYRGLPIGHENMTSLLIATNILGGSMSSRLFQEIREKKGLAYSVFAHHSVYRDSGLLTIYAGTDKEQLGLLETTINNTLTTFMEKGITEKELKNSKSQLKSNLLLNLESMNSRMNRNGRNELMLNRHLTIDEIIEKINNVDLKMVNSFIQQTISQQYSQALVTPKF